MRLNDTVIRHAKPGPKPFRLFDGGGLVPRLTDALHRAQRLAAAPYRGETWLVVAIAVGALSACVGFTMGSTSISDRSTFRGTEHAASPLIYG